jgi:hypothetical protein
MTLPVHQAEAEDPLPKEESARRLQADAAILSLRTEDASAFLKS